MKKVFTLIFSIALIFAMIMSVNSLSYTIPGSGGAPIVLKFYIDENKTDTTSFTQMNLRVNWRFGITSHIKGGLIKAESGVENSIIKSSEDNTTGRTSFTFNSDKGITLDPGKPFLTITFSSKAEYNNLNVQYYVVGDFLGIDGKNYADKNIITTELRNDNSSEETIYATQGVVTNINVEKLTGVAYEEPVEETTSIQPQATEPSETFTDTQPVRKTTEAAEKLSKKKINPMTVTVKTKTVKAKKLKIKKQSVKPLTIRKAQGKFAVALVKSGTSNKIRAKVSVSKKGVITLKKGNYTKGTYKIKVKIVAKGNSNFKAKTIYKTLKIKIK